MSIFQLPATLITVIERMMNSFWWGYGRSSNRGINWLNWEKVSINKTQGELGFKDLSAFNLAMLGKQGLKFILEPDSLVSHIFKARYFSKKSYFTGTIGHNPSHAWQSILHAQLLLKNKKFIKLNFSNYHTHDSNYHLNFLNKKSILLQIKQKGTINE